MASDDAVKISLGRLPRFHGRGRGGTASQAFPAWTVLLEMGVGGFEGFLHTS